MIFRSWLFIPGDNEKMLGKSESLDADVLVFDLEDAVVESRKTEARALTTAHLKQGRFGNSSPWVRINALDIPHVMDDLTAIMAGKPAGIILPKCEHADQAQVIADALDRLEAAHGIAAGQTKLALVAFESAKGVLNAASYTSVHERVTGLTWGSEDLSADIGATSNTDEHGQLTAPYLHARTACPIAAGAANVQAVDTAVLDFKDEDQLIASCNEARRDGFTGKVAIHPAQLDIINDAFTPSDEEIAHASAVVEAFDQQSDSGIVVLEGRMLDRPHLKQAQAVLNLAARYRSSH